MAWVNRTGLFWLMAAPLNWSASDHKISAHKLAADDAPVLEKSLANGRANLARRLAHHRIGGSALSVVRWRVFGSFVSGCFVFGGFLESPLLRQTHRIREPQRAHKPRRRYPRKLRKLVLHVRLVVVTGTQSRIAKFSALLQQLH